ncbi:MAG: L-threonylcarbamoyladenylate synthase [Actinomycetota bacterium]
MPIHAPSRGRLRAADPEAIAEGAALLRAGELVGVPTETVYGLGADATSAAAVGRIFAAKGRPADNPLIVHLADPADLARVVARVSPLAADLAARHWPGPLTLVLDAAEGLPSVTTGGHPTVGVRVPDHPVARALLATADTPMAAPSANRSGRPSPTRAEHVLDDLGEHVALVLDGGPSAVGVESTVVDARGSRPVVLREGAVSREALDAEDAGDAGDAGDAVPRAAAPGTRYRHYAPGCEVRLAAPEEVPATAARLAAAGHRVGAIAPSALLPAGLDAATAAEDPVALARLLYDGLRAAEARGVDVVVVATVAEEGIGRAVMDRLRRAAAG